MVYDLNCIFQKKMEAKKEKVSFEFSSEKTFFIEGGKMSHQSFLRDKMDFFGETFSKIQSYAFYNVSSFGWVSFTKLLKRFRKINDFSSTFNLNQSKYQFKLSSH